jgi:hypothetical protein
MAVAGDRTEKAIAARCRDAHRRDLVARVEMDLVHLPARPHPRSIRRGWAPIQTSPFAPLSTLSAADRGA